MIFYELDTIEDIFYKKFHNPFKRDCFSIIHAADKILNSYTN